MNRPRYCWDTSLYLAWLNRDETANLAEIDCLVHEINSGKAILIFSVVTYTEMLRAKHSESQVKVFDDFLKRSNVIRSDVSFPIAQKAEEIRSGGITAFKKGQKRSIKTPDAQIIATAIIQKADVLFSLEPRHHSLNGHPVVSGLKICGPRLPNGQRLLNLRVVDGA